MKKIIIIVLIILIFVAITSCDFCIGGDACSEFWKAPYHATETYGAGQIHAQLTEIAKTQIP